MWPLSRRYHRLESHDWLRRSDTSPWCNDEDALPLWFDPGGWSRASTWRRLTRSVCCASSWPEIVDHAEDAPKQVTRHSGLGLIWKTGKNLCGTGMIGPLKGFACGIGKIRHSTIGPAEENDVLFVSDGADCFDHFPDGCSRSSWVMAARASGRPRRSRAQAAACRSASRCTAAAIAETRPGP